MITPDFPCWAGSWRSELDRLRTLSAATVHQLERLFSPWIAYWRLAQQDQGPHSRLRFWNLRLVFWTFLWQVAQAGTSCREAIRQAQALCLVNGAPVPPDQNSPYCQARAALPLERLREIHDSVVTEAHAALTVQDLWCGHRVTVVDGSTLTAPDTAENQKAFPQQRSQKPGCGFPTLRLVALLSLATGMLTAWVTGSLHLHELSLLQSLWENLRPGEVLVGDRGFGNWGLLAQCVQSHIHGVFRVKGHCRSDFRRGQRLSKTERLVHWYKPKERARTISSEQWALLPAVLTLRLVRCRVSFRGFRTRQVTMVTTLLDSTQYPPSALGQLYLRRWAMELALRNIKTTLQMDYLSCKTPENLDREIRLHFLLHNLVRWLMLEAARRHRVSLDRISFAGSLAATRRYAEALLQARSQRGRDGLWRELLRVLANDLVPERPGRREPRAVKRRPKAYPLLKRPRHSFREIQHQNHYRAQRPTPSRSSN